MTQSEGTKIWVKVWQNTATVIPVRKTAVTGLKTSQEGK